MRVAAKSGHSGEKVGFCLFACLLLVAKCGCEKVHIPVERLDFSLCVLRRKSAHSSENLAAKKRTFRLKGVILLNRAAAEK